MKKKLTDPALLLLAAERTISLHWWYSCQSEVDTYTMDGECPHLLPTLVIEMTNPRSLKRLCRSFFRRQLASILPYATSVGSLPLPKAIRDYLLYQDVLDMTHYM